MSFVICKQIALGHWALAHTHTPIHSHIQIRLQNVVFYDVRTSFATPDAAATAAAAALSPVGKSFAHATCGCMQCTFQRDNRIALATVCAVLTIC